MKEKILNICFGIGIIIVLLTGLWGIIYEFFIWDKSDISDLFLTIPMIVGSLGILLIVLWWFLQRKRK